MTFGSNTLLNDTYPSNIHRNDTQPNSWIHYDSKTVIVCECHPSNLDFTETNI